MPTTPELIENAFAAKVAAIPGVESALDHEPERLPKRPCVTMLFRVPEQEDAETGPVNDVTWTWTVSLYIELRDYAKAQGTLKTLAPELLAVTRDDPTLGGTCDWARLTSAGEDPLFAHEEGYLVARFRLVAVTSEA